MSAVFSAVLKLLIITGFGIYFYRRRIVDERALNFLVFFVIHITLPCLMFTRLIGKAEIVLAYRLWWFLLFSLAIFVCGGILGAVFSLGRKFTFRREFIALVSFQNGGYLPINIALFLFPLPARDTFLVYIFLYLLGYNIIMWSLGSFLILHSRKETFDFKSLFNPPVTATLAALIFIYAGVHRFIPRFILEPLSMLGNVSFAMSAVVLGCWLGRIDSKQVFKNFPPAAAAGLIKLVLMPSLFLFLLIKIKMFSLLGLFVIMQAAMPSAASLPLIANMHGANSEFASQGVFLTHLFSVLTIPFWLGLFLKISGLSF